jgi:hypothetical protein
VADFHIPMTMPFRLRLSFGATASRTAAASDGGGRRNRGLNRPPSPPDLPQQLLCPRCGKFRRSAKRAKAEARPVRRRRGFKLPGLMPRHLLSSR